MKKLLSILLAVMMIAMLALPGCGQPNEPPPDPAPTARTCAASQARDDGGRCQRLGRGSQGAHPR